MKRNNILVAGGAGFIGSNLCRLLVKDNMVYCLDNLFTSSIDNIRDLVGNPNFSFINGDIIVFDSDIHFDQIYNLACPASPKNYQFGPLYTLDVNYFGVKNLLNLAQKNNAKFLQSSTSEIYGDPAQSPQPESYRGNVNTMGPRSCYDEGKRVAETLCYEYRNLGVDAKVVRIFNTYGPYMSKDDGRVIPNFINQALNNDDITVYGNGLQTRSLCYIDDTLRGIIKMMESDEVGPINIGNPYEITILSLAEEIINKTNSKSKIIFTDLPQDDPLRRNPDISMAKNKLNWEPLIDLESGILNTIEYFRGL